MFLSGRLPQALQPLPYKIYRKVERGREHRVQSYKKRWKSTVNAWRYGISLKLDDHPSNNPYSESATQKGKPKVVDYVPHFSPTERPVQTRTVLSDTEPSLAPPPELSGHRLGSSSILEISTLPSQASNLPFNKRRRRGRTDMQALRAELKKAEAALERRKTKDSYKILAVSRYCSESTVEKEYRSKHPDKVSVLFAARSFLPYPIPPGPR